jgi:hypothetical protein
MKSSRTSTLVVRKCMRRAPWRPPKISSGQGAKDPPRGDIAKRTMAHVVSPRACLIQRAEGLARKAITSRRSTGSAT